MLYRCIDRVNNLAHSAVVRKLVEYVCQLPRLYFRLLAGQEDYRRCPPVLVNSFPKSGTHLLYQIVQVFPDVRDFHTFIASQPTFPFRLRSRRQLIRLLTRIVPGEIVRAHLVFDVEFEKVIDKKRCVHYFIYRDLRDVAISEAYYLTYMNRWHRLHPYFKRLPNDDARISLAIMGLPVDSGIYYPDIGRRFKRFRGWLDREGVYSIKFEDLVGNCRESVIERVIEHYLECVVDSTSVQFPPSDELVHLALENIDPSKSHTFRQGRAGGWRERMTPVHKEQIELVAGDILDELGYR